MFYHSDYELGIFGPINENKTSREFNDVELKAHSIWFCNVNTHQGDTYVTDLGPSIFKVEKSGTRFFKLHDEMHLAVFLYWNFRHKFVPQKNRPNLRHKLHLLISSSKMNILYAQNSFKFFFQMTSRRSKFEDGIVQKVEILAHLFQRSLWKKCWYWGSLGGGAPQKILVFYDVKQPDFYEILDWK